MMFKVTNVSLLCDSQSFGARKKFVDVGSAGGEKASPKADCTQS